MSDKDIEFGQKWQGEIEKQLNECKFGIICVTPENQTKPWLNFEAGALSKTIGSDTYVCPYLYDMGESQFVGPLTQFQSRNVDREGTKRLVCTLNERLNEPIQSEKIEEIFEQWWPKFGELISKCPKIKEPSIARTEIDLINEILEHVRALRRGKAQNTQEKLSESFPRISLAELTGGPSIDDKSAVVVIPRKKFEFRERVLSAIEELEDRAAKQKGDMERPKEDAQAD